MKKEIDGCICPTCGTELAYVGDSWGKERFKERKERLERAMEEEPELLLQGSILE